MYGCAHVCSERRKVDVMSAPGSLFTLFIEQGLLMSTERIDSSQSSSTWELPRSVSQVLV